jgi:hypothetical protein
LPRGPVLFIAIAGLLLVVDDFLPDLPYLDTELVAMMLCFAIGSAAVAPFLRVAVDRDRLYRAAPRAAAATIVTSLSLLIAIIAAEYATRWIYRDVTTTADDRGYFTRQWIRGDNFPLNSYRTRDREHPVDKPAGTYRVAVVGDSFTYGNGLPVTQRFSDLMQTELPTNFEVMNFGHPGHNTPDHVRVIRDEVLQFHPDYILVQWFVNDVEGDSIVGRPVYRPLLPWPSLHNQLYQSSALYTIANGWWTRMQANWTVGSYVDYIQRSFGDPASAGAKLDYQATQQVIETCRNAHVGLGMVLFPDTGYDLGASYPFDNLHQRLVKHCDAEGLTCIDLRRDFAAVKDRKTLWVNPLDHHPSARANAMATVEILKAFGPAWGYRAAS